MSFTLGLHKLPFKLDSNQIIFVAGEHGDNVAELVGKYLLDIRNCFLSRGYMFCYIPELKRSLISGERQRYNAPYANVSNADEDAIDDDFILDYMTHPETRDKVPPSLLYYDPECAVSEDKEAEELLIGVPVSESSFDRSEDLREVLYEILSDMRERRVMKNRQESSGVCFSKETSDERPGRELREDSYDYVFCDRADEDFDVESRELIKEIQERVDKLRQKGIDSYIIERMFKNGGAKLSRMHITKDYRIFLSDYDDMEIEMTPLPKAVFFMFLRHSEGIRLKDRSDHSEELKEIYKRLNPSFGTEASLKSIREVTNPLSNSINEKCSRIREAFVSKFDEHLAKNYFVTGKRGEPKGILLPRHLVTWDPEVEDMMKASFRPPQDNLRRFIKLS